MGPDENVLGAMWNKLLLRLSEGELTERILFSTMQRLDAYDAALLIQSAKDGIIRSTGERDTFHLRHLARLELVAQDRSTFSLVVQTFAPIAVLPLMAGFVFDLWRNGSSLLWNGGHIPLANPWGWGVVVGGSLTLLLGLVGIYYRDRLHQKLVVWRLRWLGKELLRHVS